MYVTTTAMLIHARDNAYAVGAFNVENAEMVWAVIAAAAEAQAPVILQTTGSTLRYFPPAYFAGLVRRAAETAPVPVALHLDHGTGEDLAEQCLKEGYSSVMIDGSALPYEENIAATAKVCRLAKGYGVPVEAELGVIGGKEDDTQAGAARYTDPLQVADFVRRTGVNSLAVSIGTAHGFYQTPPVLDLDSIASIKKETDVPLVLHGASGLSDETVSRAAILGMAKINFATELRDVYTKAVRRYLEENPDMLDPKRYGQAAREAVKELAARKMEVCGCRGRA